MMSRPKMLRRFIPRANTLVRAKKERQRGSRGVSPTRWRSIVSVVETASSCRGLRAFDLDVLAVVRRYEPTKGIVVAMAIDAEVDTMNDHVRIESLQVIQ